MPVPKNKWYHTETQGQKYLICTSMKYNIKIYMLRKNDVHQFYEN